LEHNHAWHYNSPHATCTNNVNACGLPREQNKQKKKKKKKNKKKKKKNGYKKKINK
jgi:hypothetical protein